MSKKIVSLFLILLMVFSMIPAMTESATIAVADMFGREVTIEGPVTRISAMEPSDCEMLYALGCEDALVGCGMYCDYPASVMELPAVQSGSNTNLEEILVPNPQIVVRGGMDHTAEQVELLEQNSICVIGTDANSIEEVYENINLLGTVMGKEAEAESVVAEMQKTFGEVAVKSEKSKKTIYFEVMPLE